MRICVTGAAGYVGGWLLAELSRRGHEVHAQDLVYPNTGQPTWQTFRMFDLTNREAREDWLDDRCPEVVIHLAALYGRVWGEVDMYKTAGMNAGLAGQLARDCADRGARLMFMSSSEVYGTSANDGLVCPSSQLRPLNMYGLSKKWGEEASLNYCPDGIMVTRLNMPYGPSYWPPKRDEKPRTSGRPGVIGYNVLHSMLWQAEHNMDLVVHAGTERCLTWIGDSVRGLADILESGRSGIWNVCRNDDHNTVEELARRVVELTGSKSQVVVRKPPERITFRKLLDDSALRDIGWVPGTDLDEGMKLTYEYFRKFDWNGTWQG
jgi:nucleoside-diphosphate-sugar epimerase